MSDKVVAELHEPTPAVGDGGPDMIQLLTPEGERLSHPDYDKYVADLTPEDLRSFYRDLVLIRRLDAEGYALQRQGELGLWPSLLGQEAAQVTLAGLSAKRPLRRLHPTASTPERPLMPAPRVDATGRLTLTAAPLSVQVFRLR